MLIYPAQGAAGACGENCANWIAAEGTVHWDGTKRMIAALDRLAGQKLPVFLDVRGQSDLRAAMGIGRILRERGFEVAVGRTMVDQCRKMSEADCAALKRTGGPLRGSLWALETCDITCVLILSGGVRRTIEETSKAVINGTQVGHRLGLNISDEIRDGVRVNSIEQIRLYLTQMGVDPALTDMIEASGPAGKIVLSRADLIRLRVLTSQP